MKTHKLTNFLVILGFFVLLAYAVTFLSLTAAQLFHDFSR